MRLTSLLTLRLSRGCLRVWARTGGWSPFCGLLSETIVTPSFIGSLEWSRATGNIPPAINVTADLKFEDPIDIGAALDRPGWFMFVKSPFAPRDNAFRRKEGPAMGLLLSMAPTSPPPPQSPPVGAWERTSLPVTVERYSKYKFVDDHTGYCHTISGLPERYNARHGSPPVQHAGVRDADCACCAAKTRGHFQDPGSGVDCKPYQVPFEVGNPYEMYKCDVPSCVEDGSCWVHRPLTATANVEAGMPHHRQPTAEDFIDCDAIYAKCNYNPDDRYLFENSVTKFFDAKDWAASVSFDAGLQIGSWSGSDNETFPMLAVYGSINAGSGAAESFLTLKSVEPWTVYETDLFSITLPKLEGTLRFGNIRDEVTRGEYIVLELHASGPTISVLNRKRLISIKDWTVTLTLRANITFWEARSGSDLESSEAYTRKQIDWGAVDIRFEATAEMWFGMEFRMRGTIYSTSMASFEIEHEGGWRPDVDFGDLLKQFTTPRMLGYLRFGDAGALRVGDERCGEGGQRRPGYENATTCQALAFGTRAHLPAPLEIRGADNKTLVRLRGYEDGDGGGALRGPGISADLVVPFPLDPWSSPDNMSFRIEGALEFPSIVGAPLLGGVCTLKLRNQGHTGCRFSSPGWTAYNSSSFVLAFPGIYGRATIGLGNWHMELKTYTPASFGFPGVFVLTDVYAWASIILPVTYLPSFDRWSERQSQFGFRGTLRLGGEADSSTGLQATFGGNVEKSNAFDEVVTITLRHRGGWSFVNPENKWLHQIFKTPWFEGLLVISRTNTAFRATVKWTKGLDFVPYHPGLLRLVPGAKASLSLDYETSTCCDFIEVEPLVAGTTAPYCSGVFERSAKMSVPSGRPVYKNGKSFIYWTDQSAVDGYGQYAYRITAGWRCQHYNDNEPALDGARVENSDDPGKGVVAFRLDSIFDIGRLCPVEEGEPLEYRYREPGESSKRLEMRCISARVAPSPPVARGDDDEAPIETRIEASIDAALQFGNLGQLALRGVVRYRGDSLLTLTPLEVDGWTPFAGRMDELTVNTSSFFGQLLVQSSKYTFWECFNAPGAFESDECLLGRLSFRIVAGPTPAACLIPYQHSTRCMLETNGITFRVAFGDGFEEDDGLATSNGKWLRLEVEGRWTLYFEGTPENEPGLDLEMTTSVNPIGLELVIQLVHPGGWRPWPQALPFFKTPALAGTLFMNETGRFLTVEAGYDQPLEIISGVLSIKGPKNAIAGSNAGPLIRAECFIPYYIRNFIATWEDRQGGDTIYVYTNTSSPPTPPPQAQAPPSPPSPPPELRTDFEYSISVHGDVCLTVSEEEGQRCMSVSLGNTADPFIITTKGIIEDGDIRPLAPLGRIGVPDALINAAVIKGTKDYPLQWDMTIDFSAYGDASKNMIEFDCSGYAVLDLYFLRIPQFVLRVYGTGVVSGGWGFEGAFLVELPIIESGTMPGFEDDLPGVAVSFSNIDAGLLPVFNRDRNVAKGIGLYAQAKAPRWARGLCHSTVFLNITIVSTVRLVMSAECPTDIRWFRLDTPEEAFRNEGVTPIRSVEYLRLSGIRLSSDFDLSSFSYTGKVESLFQLATTAPYDAPESVRAQADPCEDITNSLCLRASFSTLVGIQVDKSYLIYNLKLQLGAHMGGAWVGTLGFEDFALLDSAIELSLKLEVVINPGTGVVAYPMLSRFAWTTLMYWRRDHRHPWPEAIYTKGDCTNLGMDVACTSWPPDLSAGRLAETTDGPVEVKNVVGVQTTFLLELAPHSHEALSLAKIPKFGFRVAISDVFADDIVGVFVSLARGMINNMIARKPSQRAVQQRAMPALFKAQDDLNDFKGALSPYMDREVFDLLFSFEFEIAVVSEMGLRPGFHVAGEMEGTLFGSSCIVGLEFSWHPGELDEKMLTDWFNGGILDRLLNGGIGFSVELLNFPYVAAFRFVGLVNRTDLIIESNTQVTSPPYLGLVEEGVLTLDVRFAIEGRRSGSLAIGGAPKYELRIAFYFETTITLIGAIRARGLYAVDSKALATANLWNDFDIEGAVSTRIFGFCFAGSASFLSSIGVWTTLLTLELEGYGSFNFQGRIGDYDALLSAELAMTPQASLEATKAIVRGIAWAIVFYNGGLGAGIAGIITSGPVINALAEFLTSVFTLTRAYGLIDANKFMFELEIDFSINGVSNQLAFGIPSDFSSLGERRHRRSLHEEFARNASAHWRAANAFADVELSPEAQYARANGEGDDHVPWGTTARQWHDHHVRRRTAIDLCAYCDSATGATDPVCLEDSVGGEEGSGGGGGRRRRLRQVGTLDFPHIQRSMRETMSYEYLQAKIGDIDRTIAFAVSFPLLNYHLALSTRVIVNAAGIEVTCAGSFSLLGIRLSGSGKLSTDGGIVELNYEGTGVFDLGVTWIPALSGTVHLTYLDRVASLYMATSCTFLGLQLSGTASFSTSGLIDGFEMQADLVDTTFTDGLKDTLVNIVGRLGGSRVAEQLRTARGFRFLEVSSIRLRYVGSLNDIFYQIGFTLDGVAKMLEFVNKDHSPLVTLFDLLPVIGALGREVLAALAPLDISIEILWVGAPICLPAFPCVCGAELYCPSRRRSRSLAVAGANASSAAAIGDASAQSSKSGRVQPTALAVSFVDGDGLARFIGNEDGEKATSEEGDVTGNAEEDGRKAQERPGAASEDLGEMMAGALEGELGSALGSTVKIVRMVAKKSTGPIPYQPLLAHETIRNRNDSQSSHRVVLPPLSKEQEEALRRRLGHCGLFNAWTYRMRMTACCGERTCIAPKLQLSSVVRLQITESIVAVDSSARLQLLAPGFGLHSIDKTVSARSEISYGEVNTLCDLVPSLGDFCLGRLGGGQSSFSLKYLGLDFWLDVFFDSTDVCLDDILPCQLLSI